MRQLISLLCLIALIPLAACTGTPGPEKLNLTATSTAQLPGWDKDDVQSALTGFKISCARILKVDPQKAFDADDTRFGIYADWQNACHALTPEAMATPEAARAFIADYFNTYAADNGNASTGLLTGYYEPSLQASPQQTPDYQIPIRARPADLVMVNLGEFRPALKGQRIAGRVKDGQLKPYEDRAAIETGKLPKDMDNPIFWARDAADVFFLQIQGSGVLQLPDGSAVRVGYDGQNGHPYTAIGKELVARGALPKENVTMQSIRDWLAAHPNEATEVMRLNQSYVFFKKLDTDGPVGAEGVVLTPERSMAVDRKFIPYGTPIYIEADNPKLQRLMIAQDTGGAIQGALRGDMFWGYGERAAAMAGPMKARTKFWVLIPKPAAPQIK